ETFEFAHIRLRLGSPGWIRVRLQEFLEASNGVRVLYVRLLGNCSIEKRLARSRGCHQRPVKARNGVGEQAQLKLRGTNIVLYLSAARLPGRYLIKNRQRFRGIGAGVSCQQYLGERMPGFNRSRGILRK